jgi:hypothetical protein
MLLTPRTERNAEFARPAAHANTFGRTSTEPSVAVIVIATSKSTEPLLAHEDSNVDGAYTAPNSRGPKGMRCRWRKLRASL